MILNWNSASFCTICIKVMEIFILVLIGFATKSNDKSSYFKMQISVINIAYFIVALYKMIKIYHY